MINPALVKSLLDSAESLPQSLLFSGERYSGRLSAAFSLISRLEKNEETERYWRSSDIAFIPERDLSLELDCAYNLLLERTCTRTKDYFVKRVMSILLQYHRAFLKSGDKKKEKLFSDAADIDQMLYSFIETSSDDKEAITALASDIYTLARRDEFIKCMKKKSILCADEVRAFNEYAESGGANKYIIIENIENASEQSKNAMLKILEEPPRGVYFILISSSPSRIMSTILSRVRKIDFPQMRKEDLGPFLLSEFLESGSYSSLSDFFYSKSVDEEERKKIEEHASYFYSLFDGRKRIDNSRINEIFTLLEKVRGFSLFYSLIVKKLENDYSHKRISALKAKTVLNILTVSDQNSSVYSQSRKASLEGALRKIRCL